jgi:hypothetical protein
VVIALGICKIPYMVPSDIANGSYYLIVSAHYPGGVQYEAVFGSALCSFLISSTLTEWAAWLAEINASLIGLQGSLAVVQSDVGLLMLDLASINASIIGIQGNLVAIESDIGSIQVGLADLSTDLNDLISVLEGWMIVTTELVVGEVAFDSQILTNSTVDDFSSAHNILTITLRDESNANGLSHVWIPKALMEEIGSNVEKVVVTLNEERANFTVAEGDEYYVITMTYDHNVDVITIYLEGIYPPFPLELIILVGILMTVVVAATCLVYRSKMRV